VGMVRVAALSSIESISRRCCDRDLRTTAESHIWCLSHSFQHHADRSVVCCSYRAYFTPKLPL